MVFHYSRHLGWVSNWKWPKVSPEGRSANSGRPLGFSISEQLDEVINKLLRSTLQIQCYVNAK